MTLLFLKRLNDTFEENAEKLIEKGEYKCMVCNNTIAVYRKFNK